MVVAIRHPSERTSRYAGLRMSANEFLAMSDDGYRYELIDKVVVMSANPTPEHQDI